MTIPESASKASSVESEIMSRSSSKSFSRYSQEYLTDLISLWNNQASINTINQTYEIDTTIEAWNYRSHLLLGELEDQVKRFACSGGVWTQTTDVEGEVNGLMTYDRRLKRVDEDQWKSDIQALYTAAAGRSNATMSKP